MNKDKYNSSNLAIKDFMIGLQSSFDIYGNSSYRHIKNPRNKNHNEVFFSYWKRVGSHLSKAINCSKNINH